jgi:hypothetical protein
MSHHIPFKSLSPLSWQADIAPHTAADSSSSADLAALFTSTLTNAQLLIDSIPTPTPPLPSSSSQTTPGRTRSHTDSGVSPASFTVSTTNNAGAAAAGRDAADKETVKKLNRDWKDLKVQQNPHGIIMYKMGAKDGKGAWFARRSLHRAEKGGFEKWYVPIVPFYCLPKE